MTQSLTARQIVLAARPAGRPLPSDFRLEEVAVPTPGVGEVLLATRHLSLDPYMRGRMEDRRSYSPPTPLGGVMEGEAVAEVLSSNDPDHRPGDMVLARTGWRTHAVLNGGALKSVDGRFEPATLALGVLGMPGFTAYAGLLTIGRPVVGETVVVAAASGPVGSLVGQIARLKGARAVGIAGGPEKCAFVLDEYGFDAVVDHRAPDFAERLASVCPDGVDVYFENVGGAVWDAVFPLLNHHARVPVCGLVGEYGNTRASNDDQFGRTMREVLSRRLLVQGFINYDLLEHHPAFLADVSGWLADGSVRYREDVVDGLENAPDAFIGMLEGRNFGKLLVRM